MTDFQLDYPATASHFAPSVAEIMHLRLVASGRAMADRIVRGGKVLVLHTGEILERDVVIAGRHIAAVTPVGHFDAPEIIDATGYFVGPTFIDAHIHIEYTKLTPGELARLSIPRGTTTVLADANCAANVMGLDGLDFMGTTTTPLKILRQVSFEVPHSPHLRIGGARLKTEEIATRVQMPNAVTLGEGNPFALDEASAIKQASAIAAGKRITGHTALLKNEPLWGFLAGGVGDDHNAHKTEDVVERLRLGAMLTVMAGSMNDNTPHVFADIPALKDGIFHVSFCADDKLVEDLDGQGHIDHHVRKAIECGVDPVKAWRMATLSPAAYYRLDQYIGSITPSRIADLQLVADLADPRPALVIVDGKVAARDGKALFENRDPIPDCTRGTIRLSPDLSIDALKVTAPGNMAYVQAMEMYDGYFKRAFHAEMPVIDGNVQSDTTRDILKVAVIDRHKATPSAGVGFVRGFRLKRGALAASTNCDDMNIVVMGATDAEMMTAINEIKRIGGGFTVVDGEKVLYSVPLPVAGCMSDQPWEVVAEQSRACDRAAESIGCEMHAPFMIMSFIGLSVVPDLGLTELGLIDTAAQGFTDVVLGLKGGLVCCRCPSHAHDVHKLMGTSHFVAEEV